MQGKKKTEPELLRERDELHRRLAEAKSREAALEQAVQKMRKDCEWCTERLDTCEEKFRLLFETANDAIILQDGDLFVDCNAKALDVFGCSERSELIGHRPAEFSPELQPDGIPSFEKAQEYIRAAVQDNPQKFYWRARRRDGGLLDLEVSLNAFMLGDKRLLQGIARDVSAEKATEQELKGMLNFFQTLMDTIPGSIFYKDSRGVYQGCNKAYETFLGLTKEEIVGKTLHEIFPRDLADKYNEMDQELFTNPGKQVYEWQISAADGTRHDVIFSKATFRDRDGAVGGLVGVMIDITARKQAEERLRENEEILRMMTETAQDAVIMMGSEGKITFWNAAAEKMFGYTAQESLGRDLHLLLAPERYHDEYRRGFSHFRATGQGPAVGKTLELVAFRKDGAEFPIELSMSATRIRGRWTAGGMVRDISERKRAEKALQASEERYRSIFENAVWGIFQSSPEGCILNTNQAQARMFGYDSPQEMMDAFTDIAYEHYVHPGDREKFKEICDAEGFIRGFESQFYKKNREIIWISLNARTVRDAEGKTLHYEGFAEDITQRKQTEKALRDSERFLAEIIDFLPDATFVVDTSGRILIWNRAMEKMTNARAEDMIGKGDYEYGLAFYGERRAMLLDLLLKPDANLESQYEIFEREVGFLTVEGDRIIQGAPCSLLGKAGLLFDSEGNMRGAIESLRDITQRKKAEEELKNREQELLIKSRSLEEINIALKVLLGRREKDKGELEDSITLNMQKLVTPYIDKLKNSPLGSREAAYVQVLEMSLNDIISPFASKLSSKLMTLTPKEIEIAKLVKDGKTTKEVANLLHSSIRAVEFHRDNIRKKLALNKSNKNLRAYLLSLS
jgi:PAS domain S-box-containing protein